MGVALPSWLLPLLLGGGVESRLIRFRAEGSAETSPREVATLGTPANPPSKLPDTMGAGWGVSWRGRARLVPDTASILLAVLMKSGCVSPAGPAAPLTSMEDEVPVGKPCTAGKARYTHQLVHLGSSATTYTSQCFSVVPILLLLYR